MQIRKGRIGSECPCKESHSSGDLLGRPHAAHGNCLDQGIEFRGRDRADFIGHRGVDPGGTDGIHAYAAAGIDRMLARAVIARERYPHQAGDRRRIDDRTAALLEHLLNFLLETEAHAEYVDGHELGEILLGGVRRADAEGSADAGVVMRAIEPPVCCDDCRHRRFHVGGFADVDATKYRLAAGILDEFDRQFAAAFVDVGDGDLGARRP